MTEQSVGELVRQASEQFSDLVRRELQLAQAEMAVKGRRIARGSGFFVAAGMLAGTGFLVLVATGVIALDLRLPLWQAGLVMAAALLAPAALLALAGRRQARRAAPMVPEQTVREVKADVQEIKERVAHHDQHPRQDARAGRDGTRQAR